MLSMSSSLEIHKGIGTCQGLQVLGNLFKMTAETKFILIEVRLDRVHWKFRHFRAQQWAQKTGVEIWFRDPTGGWTCDTFVSKKGALGSFCQPRELDLEQKLWFLLGLRAMLRTNILKPYSGAAPVDRELKKHKLIVAIGTLGKPSLWRNKDCATRPPRGCLEHYEAIFRVSAIGSTGRIFLKRDNLITKSSLITVGFFWSGGGCCSRD
ncbi:hypothetical protein Tco_0521775 [Tanacetum coccineum]